jgi:hypothetical protein
MSAAPGTGYPPGYPPPGYQAAPAARRRRVFWWVFLAVQVLFIVWLIAGLASSAGTPAAHDIAVHCAHGTWHGLFGSYAECAARVRTLDGSAGGIAMAIGPALIVGLWVAADVILGIGYRLCQLATRR